MYYDVVIIGAGMSGLAAGIRLAYFGKRVCILEKHYAYGGLNSYYIMEGRELDVGLHALTNYVPPGTPKAPLTKLLRQLRLKHEDFDLRPQGFSEIRFPGRRLRFTNDISVLIDEVAREFPREVDGFRRMLRDMDQVDIAPVASPYRSTRETLAGYLGESKLIDMLLCPIMYYGSAEEHDMDWTQFVILCQSIFREGFARPREGVRTIIKTLVRKFRACGGTLRMRCGVERINVASDRVTDLILENGEVLTPQEVLSSAGFFETMRLCSDVAEKPPPGEAGRVSFVETISLLDELPQRLGHEATIVFFNDAETFTYARPDDAVDLRSGVICCPSNYEGHDDMAEGVFRVTWLANGDRWLHYDETTYRRMKGVYQEHLLEFGARYVPDFRRHVVFSDMFTPRTIKQFTGHLNGAVYGAPRKIRDGRTRLNNLFLCGTDQGYLGVIGAMMSGVTMANLHVLSKS